MSLSSDQLHYLNRVIIEREDQIDLLNAFINKDPELLSAITIVHGYKSVGKTYAVLNFLNSLDVNHSVVKCDECITRKMLLRRCYDKIRKNNQTTYDGLISDNFSTFIAALESLPEIENHEILVLDRFDQCFENCNDILASFARFRESSSIKNISIIVIMSGSDPKEISTFAIPHIHFKPYTESQVIKILQRDQLKNNELENGQEVFNQYVKFIVDLFFPFTGSDIFVLLDILHKLWNRFIEPIKLGICQPNEFVKLYQENIDLFTNEEILYNSNVIDYKTKRVEEEINTQGGNVQDLPMNSKFFLIASYLASYGAPKNDLHKYSKVKAVKYKQRQTTNSPKKQKTHMSKDDIDSRLLSAAYCDLERILAILAVIYRNSAPSLNHSDKDNLLYIDDEVIDNEEKKEMEKSKFTLTKNIDLSIQIATLYSLGFLSKTASSDILGARVRWKCNLDWNTVEALAKSVNVPINDYLMDEFN